MPKPKERDMEPVPVAKEAAAPTMAELLEQRLKIGVSMGRLITEIGWNYENYVKVQSAIISRLQDEYCRRHGIERVYSPPTWSRQTWIVEALRSAVALELSKYEKGSMKETLQGIAAEGVLMKDGIEEGFKVTNASLEQGR